MSLVEQGAASRSDAEVSVPEFPVGMRGYDRQQVDVFVRDLTIRLTAERRRAEQAERQGAQLRAEVASLRNQPAPSFEHLGAEAARVLEGAGMSAKLLMEEARNRGQAVIGEAEGQARELIEHAERRAAALEGEAGETLAAAATERERILSEASQAVEEVRSQAEEEARTALEHARSAANQMRQKAESEQLVMQGETERLSESRDRMIDYLGRIHADLGELLAEAVQADAAMSGGSAAAAHAEALDDEAEMEVDGEHATAVYSGE
jgi:cell division septum initiation protein DivIVA